MAGEPSRFFGDGYLIELEFEGEGVHGYATTTSRKGEVRRAAAEFAWALDPDGGKPWPMRIEVRGRHSGIVFGHLEWDYPGEWWWKPHSCL